MQPPAKKQRACGLFSCEDPSAGALSTSFQVMYQNDAFFLTDFVPIRRLPIFGRLESV